MGASTEWVLGGIKEKGVATQFYGLGTMYIAPLRGMTDLSTRVWVQSLGMVLGRCQAPKTTRLVGRLSLHMFYILILLKACSTLHTRLTHTHTLTFNSNQHGISNQNPSIHVSYISYILGIHLSWQSSKPRAYIYPSIHLAPYKICHIISKVAL